MPRTSPSPETASPVALCDGCGRAVLWIIADGMRIPLDQGPPTYLLRVDARQDGLPLADRSRAYVSHWATCAKAHAFSGNNTPRIAAQEPQGAPNGDQDVL